MTPAEPLRPLNRGGLRLIDGESGQVLASERKHTYEDLMEINTELRRKFEGAILENGRLRKELADKQEQEAGADDVRAVLEYWRDKCTKRPQSVRLVSGSPRWKKTRERLNEGYSRHDLGDAIRGALLSKYHVDNGYLKAETIFRDSGTVDDHAQRYWDWAFTPQGEEHFFNRCQRFMREQGWHDSADIWLGAYLRDRLDAERGQVAA